MMIARSQCFNVNNTKITKNTNTITNRVQKFIPTGLFYENKNQSDDSEKHKPNITNNAGYFYFRSIGFKPCLCRF